jgi:hypothetical protein
MQAPLGNALVLGSTNQTYTYSEQLPVGIQLSPVSFTSFHRWFVNGVVSPIMTSTILSVSLIYAPLSASLV